jgi:hypothetical protein
MTGNVDRALGKRHGGPQILRQSLSIVSPPSLQTGDTFQLNSTLFFMKARKIHGTVQPDTRRVGWGVGKYWHADPVDHFRAISVTDAEFPNIGPTQIWQTMDCTPNLFPPFHNFSTFSCPSGPTDGLKN